MMEKELSEHFNIFKRTKINYMDTQTPMGVDIFSLERYVDEY